MRTLPAVLTTLIASTALSSLALVGWRSGDSGLEPWRPTEATRLAAAGRCDGPASQSSRVEAFGSVTWRLCFTGYGQARIRVDGDNDTDLDCFVYNADGVELARDDDETDYCVLDWNNRSRQTVRLRIDNLGNVYNRYQLWTN